MKTLDWQCVAAAVSWMIVNALVNDSAVGQQRAVVEASSAANSVSHAAAPAVILSAASLAFANQVVDTRSSAKTVTLKNGGTASLTLTSIELTGNQAHDFSLTKTCGATLAAGASCNISVEFTPILVGAKTSSVSIIDNASGSPHKIALTGTGTGVTATPRFSPAGGTYTASQTVTIADASTGAVIYYTTNGTTPTISSERYSDGITVNGTITIKALAVAAGYTQSALASATYKIIDTPITATALYSFSGSPTGDEYPVAGLIQDRNGNFYGTAGGGDYTGGTVFMVTPAGVETVLHAFSGGIDGYSPRSPLIQSGDGDFYGTTYNGGSGVSGPYGTVYKITATGHETVFYNFPARYIDGTLVDGERPAAAVVQGSDGNLYGTTVGGQNGSNFTNGSVFKINPAGLEVWLYSFTGGADGASSGAPLIEARDGNLYGTTDESEYSDGTVFRITPDGVEAVVHSFGTGADGKGPIASLIQADDGNFYGTTQNGGTYGYGTVFKITQDGRESVLHSFGSGTDGANPVAPLIQGSDGNLYGTTMYGGTYAPSGTVFKITPDGIESVIYSFAPAGYGYYPNGEQPQAPLIQGIDGNLYGTAEFGGAYASGTIFKLTGVIQPATSPKSKTETQSTSP